MAPLAAYAGSWGTGSPSPNIDQEGRRSRSSRLWIKYPPLDAAVVDSGNPRRFLLSTSWKKAMDVFHR